MPTTPTETRAPRVIPKRRRPAGPPAPMRWGRALLVVLGVLLVVLSGGILAGWSWLNRGLPDPEAEATKKLPEATWVVATDGSVLGELYDVRRRSARGRALPDIVREAFVAVHDPTFETRPPLSVRDLIRAALSVGPYRSDGQPGGISVPLARQMLPHPRNLQEQARVWVMAMKLERALSKDRLMALYLDRADFGEGGFGVNEAALHFFSVRGSDLTVSQAAVLASIPARPSRYSPRGFPEPAKKRRDRVLEALRTSRLISEDEAQRAESSPVALRLFSPPFPGFLAMVRSDLRHLPDHAKVATAGLTVNVTVDRVWQQRAEAAMRDATFAADELSGWRGPLTSMDGALYDQVLKISLGGNPGLIDLQPALPLLVGKDPAAVARAVKLYAPGRGSIIAGRVSAVGTDDLDVQVGSSTARVGVARSSWVQIGHTPPAALKQLFHAGDVVVVRLLDTTTTPWQARLEQRAAMNGAAVVAEAATGRVLAAVGGVTPGSFDRARHLRRSIGAAESIVPFAQLLQSGGTAATLIRPAPATVAASAWDGEVPNIDDERSREQVTAFEAFKTEDLLATQALAAQKPSSPEQPGFAALMSQLGFRHTDTWGSVGVLGSPWTVARLFSAVADDGKVPELRVIDEIHDRDGQSIWAPPDASLTLCSPQSAQLLRAWLTQAFGVAGMPSHYGHNGWFAGAAGRVSAAVWVGADGPGLPAARLMGNGAARQAFTAITSGESQRDPDAASATLAHVNPDDGLLSRDSSGIDMPFTRGTAPTRFSSAAHARPRSHRRR